jgi:hypothetical protein
VSRRKRTDDRPWEVVDTTGERPPTRCWYRSTARELAAALGDGFKVRRVTADEPQEVRT